jgi:hypothetical protein
MSKDVGCDIFGLDGTLYFQTGYVKRDDAIVYKIGDLVSKHYGFPYEIVNHKTFFDALENNYVRV